MDFDASHITRIFSPPAPKLPLDLAAATDAIKLQKQAHITKTALFVLASLSATCSLLLIEASIIIWPILIPALITTAVAGSLFYLINNNEQRYLTGLDDETKTTLAKEALEKLFYHTPCGSLTRKQIIHILKDINLLLGYHAFTRPYIYKIIDLHTRFSEGAHKNDSLADLAEHSRTSLLLKRSKTWHEKGRFGHHALDRNVDISWQGKKNLPIEVICKTDLANR